MKIRVTLKDPDSMPDAVEEAFRKAARPDGVSREEWAAIADGRAQAASDAITDSWMPYREYLTVEFDTEAGTATVIPASEFR